MEQELIRISERCKERGILFSRDWDAVTQPSLVRETPSAYQKINMSIREGNQGVIQKVQHMVLDTVNQNQAQREAGADVHGQDRPGIDINQN